MKPILRSVNNDRGSAMIIALLILVVLTILGITATTTTEIEVMIAGNERFHKIAFYNTDSGIYSTPKLIRECVEAEDGTQPVLTSISYLVGGTNNFFRQVMGYDAYDSGVSDIQFALGGNNVQMDVQKTSQETLVGGSSVFAEGTSAIGGGAGGIAIKYTMDSLGTGPSNSQSYIEGVYRLIPGIAGGL